MMAIETKTIVKHNKYKYLQYLISLIINLKIIAIYEIFNVNNYYFSKQCPSITKQLKKQNIVESMYVHKNLFNHF